MTEKLGTVAESLDRLKESFLYVSARNGNKQECMSLLEIGADINWKSDDGDTPLLAACRRGHADVISLLLDHGADSNIAGDDSYAPLHVCARRGDYDSLTALLDGPSTSVSIVTRDGLTALDIAKNKNFTDIKSALMGIRTRQQLPRVGGESLQPNAQLSPMPLAPIPLVSRLSTVVDLPAVAGTSRASASTSMNTSGFNAIPPLMCLPVGSVLSVSGKGTKTAVTEGKRLAVTTSSSSKEAVFLPPTSSYTIAGQQTGGASYSCDDPALMSLRLALDRETTKRKGLQSTLDVFKDQNTQMLRELTSLNAELSALQDVHSETDSALGRLLCRPRAMEAVTSIEECEELERTLKVSLDAVEVKKALLIRDQIENQKEQRQCVICQEKEKSVVLLPCRHLCLCVDCSGYEQITTCPLCRKHIESKFVVFS